MGCFISKLINFKITTQLFVAPFVPYYVGFSMSPFSRFDDTAFDVTVFSHVTYNFYKGSSLKYVTQF